MLTPLGTGIQDAHEVLITQMKQCSHFTTQNTKSVSQERGTKNEPQQETRGSYKTLAVLARIPRASYVIPKINSFFAEKNDNHIIFSKG